MSTLALKFKWVLDRFTRSNASVSADARFEHDFKFRDVIIYAALVGFYKIMAITLIGITLILPLREHQSFRFSHVA